MIITICGSRKFANEIEEWKDRLKESPNMSCSVLMMEEIEKGDLTSENKSEIMNIHFLKIRMSDAILVVNKDGYIGNNVWMEIGIAYSLGKAIYVIEPKNMNDELVAIGAKMVLEVGIDVRKC